MKDPEDKIKFLVDVDRLDLLESDNIPTSLFELFIKKRKPLVSKVRNFRKSQRSKLAWQKKRFKYMAGINRFHRSIKGKKMHRAMGRFVATRIFRGDESVKLNDANEVLKAISSIRTHIYIEADYYMPLQEEVEFREFVEYAIPLLNSLETQLFKDSSYCPLDEELELLLRVTEELSIQKAIVEITKKIVHLNTEFERGKTLHDPDSEFFKLSILKNAATTIEQYEDVVDEPKDTPSGQGMSMPAAKFLGTV